MDGAVPSAYQLSPLRPLIYHLRPTPAPAHARLTFQGDTTARPNFTDGRLGGTLRCDLLPSGLSQKAKVHIHTTGFFACQSPIRNRDAAPLAVALLRRRRVGYPTTCPKLGSLPAIDTAILSAHFWSGADRGEAFFSSLSCDGTFQPHFDPTPNFQRQAQSLCTA